MAKLIQLGPWACQDGSIVYLSRAFTSAGRIIYVAELPADEPTFDEESQKWIPGEYKAETLHWDEQGKPFTFNGDKARHSALSKFRPELFQDGRRVYELYNSSIIKWQIHDLELQLNLQRELLGYVQSCARNLGYSE